MIKAFILYFLNIKSTHGYEIQKYIELNRMNDWTKIQSGSIYYALAKLEKEKLIKLERTEIEQNKQRKIYSITQIGKKELQNLLIEALNKPIYNEKSDKFVAYPFICGINSDLLKPSIQNHIEGLKAKKSEIEYWKDKKITDASLKIEQISFEMMISSIDYQIAWHEALLDEMDTVAGQSDLISKFIADINFTNVNSTEDLYRIINRDYK